MEILSVFVISNLVNEGVERTFGPPYHSELIGIIFAVVLIVGMTPYFLRFFESNAPFWVASQLLIFLGIVFKPHTKQYNCYTYTRQTPGPYTLYFRNVIPK